MAPDYAQRRRVAIAAAITVIAVPTVLLLGPDDGDDTSQVIGTVASSIAADSGGGRADRPTDDTDPMGTSPAAFLDGTVPTQIDDPATIAIPRLPDAVEGTATFSRTVPNPQSCQVRAALGAPFGRPVTVTNLDNSRSVQCINIVVGLDPDEAVVLHPDAFSEIGDLTDAPVPIQLTW